MGATELQIFVSLVVVLGAAFVALICDFLKGSNERLREANLELRVRQDQQHSQQAPVNRREVRVSPSQAEFAMAAQMVVPKVASATPDPEIRAAVGQEEDWVEMPMAGGRRRGRQSQQEQRAAQMEAWAQELVQRKITAPVVPYAVGATEAVVADAEPDAPGLSPLSPGEALMGIWRTPEPPMGVFQSQLPAVEPPIATAEAVEKTRRLRMAEGFEPIIGLPLPGLAAVTRAAEPIPLSSTQDEPEFGSGAFQATGVEVGEAGLIMDDRALPLRLRTVIRGWPVMPQRWAESAIQIPPSKLGLEGVLSQAPEVEAPVQESQGPIVRIRVLREDLEEEVAAPGPLESPLLEDLAPVVPKREADRPKGEPAFVTEPMLPRENRRNVVELPITVPAASEIPAGWNGVERLRQLAGSPAPFEGLAVAVAVNEYERLVAQFGESRCREALSGLASSLDVLAAESDFLCQSGEEEFVLLFPGLPGSEQPAKLRLLAEVLWDFQLRTLSSVPMLCAWGAAEGQREPLSAILGRAREQMVENRRVKRGGTSLLSRFRRRVVNA